jgi:hypothetical protein
VRREVGDECRRPDASRGNPRPGLAATDDRVVSAAKRKYYTPPDSYHYSGFTNLWYTFEYHCQDGTRPALDMGLTKGCLEVEQVEWWKRELPMSDQDVAMRIAVASAFRDCGLPSDEQDVDDFLVALRSFGYVVERLDHRTGDE